MDFDIKLIWKPFESKSYFHMALFIHLVFPYTNTFGDKCKFCLKPKECFGEILNSWCLWPLVPHRQVGGDGWDRWGLPSGYILRWYPLVMHRGPSIHGNKLYWLRYYILTGHKSNMQSELRCCTPLNCTCRQRRLDARWNSLLFLMDIKLKIQNGQPPYCSLLRIEQVSFFCSFAMGHEPSILGRAFRILSHVICL